MHPNHNPGGKNREEDVEATVAGEGLHSIWGMKTTDDGVGLSENSPLMMNQQQNGSSRGGKSSLWKSVKALVQEGHFLVAKPGKNLRGSTIGKAPSSRSMQRFPSGRTHRMQVFEECDEGLTFSTQQCLTAILLYMVVSVCVFTFVLEPHWTIVDSCYFAISTFTTLGYGNVTPTHTGSVIFTCIYALLGVACLGLTLGIIGHNLLDRKETYEHLSQAMYKQQAMTLFETGTTTHSLPLPSEDDNRSKNTTSTTPTTTPSPKKVVLSFFSQSNMQVYRVLLLLGVIGILASLIGRSSGWDFLSTIYFVIVTGCTIGYGDLAPTTQSERLLAIFFIPLVVLFMTHWLGFFANYIIESKNERFRTQFELRDLTEADLSAMDVSGSGKVTRAEFLEFMLVAMNKIDFELVDELSEYFQTLDVDGNGEISRDDLIENARRKLKTPRRKLELAAYKRRLLSTKQDAAGTN